MTDAQVEIPVPEHLRRWHELDPATVERGTVGFVWGNCQAESIRRMVAPAGAAHGVEFVRLPPVFEMTEGEVDRLHELVATAGVLVTQPVKDEYRVPGCGSEQLVALLPTDAQVVRVPTTYYEGLFPWQVHAHDADGARVDAPLTDYHDLRLLRAAVDGLDVEGAVDRVLACTPDPAAVRDLAARSQAELRRRNAALDVDTTDAVVAGGAEAMWTVNHPANDTLRAVGAGALAVLGWDGEPAVPDHQMLGSAKAPLDAAVLAALDLDPALARPRWVLGGREVPWAEVAGAQLGLYAQRPDVARRAVDRYADRLAALGC
ncbi:WcbI family polysaccharide biosynthesis putative acetyltransferase [Klenkia sp. LSe6-5]|uniref:WcbI family polysaccharide biosynthesis putative acetyltransferase n=1 Tax=Klenkia sesuvii TaxID=3103137 RepID=A0ABU8DPR6_9ACTN